MLKIDSLDLGHFNQNQKVRDIAVNIYYTESTSTGGLNTFFGALKGGARHYFIIEEGGANKNLSNPDARYRIG